MKKSMLVAAMFLAAASTTAQAQVVKPFTFGVSAGAAIPTGKSGDYANTGINLSGIAEYRTPTMPVTLRGELSYDRLGMKGLPSNVDGHHSILGAVVSVVKPFAPSASLAPYVIGGTGVYSVKSTASDGTVDVSTSRTAMGLNGGMGVQFHLAGLRTFAEARYQHVFSKDVDKGFENATSIPVVFGFRF